MKAAFPDVMPFLTVNHVGEALDFYGRAFGLKPFSEPMKNPATGEIYHADLACGQGVIMLGLAGPVDCPKSPAETGRECPLSLYVYVDNVDEHYLRSREAKAETISPPADMFWGDRVYSAKCPQGYRWNFATHTGKYSAPPL
jgi:uncharacterized glyoxalase superfamily protein PhnB